MGSGHNWLSRTAPDLLSPTPQPELVHITALCWYWWHFRARTGIQPCSKGANLMPISHPGRNWFPDLAPAPDSGFLICVLEAASDGSCSWVPTHHVGDSLAFLTVCSNLASLQPCEQLGREPADGSCVCLFVSL